MTAPALACPGWRCEVFETLPSTSDEAIRRAADGDPGRLALLALRQTSGRGSRGRRWQDAPRGNLALSVLLRPAVQAGRVGEAVFAAGLAMIEALDPYAGGGRLALKWPNDVLVDGAKLGGILVESAVDHGRLSWVAIGFGANLAEKPVQVPGGRAVGCLADCGSAAAPEMVAASLLRRLDHWMVQPFDTVRTAWLARAHPAGTMLEVDGELVRYVGIATDGALLAEAGDATRRFSTGAVFAPPSPAPAP